MYRNRWLIALGAIATAFVLVSADAHARVAGGFSEGSPFSAPPATPTDPALNRDSDYAFELIKINAKSTVRA